LPWHRNTEPVLALRALPSWPVITLVARYED
jgi:hypothetical protein